MSHTTRNAPAPSLSLADEGDDYAAIDRLLEAIHRGTMDTFINDEADREGVPIAIGTLVMRDEPPRWATAAATFFKLARHAQSRPALKAHVPALRDAARTCAAIAAVMGSHDDRMQVSTIVAGDPAEKGSLLDHILRLSPMSVERREEALSCASKAPGNGQALALTFENALKQARMIREMILNGRDDEARAEALALGRRVIDLLLLSASTDEGMLPRSRLAAVLRALSSSGALDGSNVIPMVDAALKADVEAIRTTSQAPLRPIR